jgi:hypothetical protein
MESRGHTTSELDQECIDLILETLEEFESVNLAFSLSDEVQGDETVFWSDFTPRARHPRARDYSFFMVPGRNPIDAVRNARTKLKAHIDEEPQV